VKYAPLLLLVAAAPAQASGWVWTCPEVKAEIRRIDRLTRYDCGMLTAAVEQERAAFNQQTMSQYNRALPIPMPMMLTPEFPPAPGPRTFFPRW
jgi:hypothetical protein